MLDEKKERCVKNYTVYGFVACDLGLHPVRGE